MFFQLVDQKLWLVLAEDLKTGVVFISLVVQILLKKLELLLYVSYSII